MLRRLKSSWLVLFLLLWALGTAGAAPSQGGDDPPDFAPPEIDPNAVTASLVSRSETVVPGKPLELGIHLHMKPGWHTYWQNGGDAGLPTSVQWTLPEGLKAGEILWPTPYRYVESGELVTYGYMDDVLLLTEITVPADLPASGKIEIGAKVTWLMCKALCVPGEAELSLSLPVATQLQPDSSVAALFRGAHERLPRPAAQYEGMQSQSYLSMNAIPPGQSAHAAFVVEGPVDFEQAEATWFPRAETGVQSAEPTIEAQQGKLSVIVPFSLDQDLGPDSKEARLSGVLQLRQGAKQWFLSLVTPIPVAQEGESIHATHSEIFDTLTGVGSAESTPLARGPLWHYLLLALLGGVILNVMPCVLPVLSLKVLSFVNHSDRDRATVMKLSLVFSLGVLASFLALSLTIVALQSAGQLLGWGFQFQNPTFVVVMVAIVFGFGLSLFGLFEIIPPAGSFRGSHGMYGEQFFNGVLATILATPCSAPFLGSALGFAFTQPPVSIIAIFLTIGVGLSLPYVLLSVNPAWLRFVPKPGPWMERFKQFMGFLLMATVVWLLWVVSQQLGTTGLVHVLWFILVLALALWIHGAYLSLSSSVPRRLLVWAISLALVVGGWQYFLRDTLSSEGIARAQAANGTVAEERVEGVTWVPFSPDALQEAVTSGNTVFVDFTAAWCLTCKANEKAVIDTKEVTNKLKELGVVTMLGDWTQRDPVISKVLREHGRSGVPFYAVFPANRLDDPIVLPEVIDKALVIDALEKAGKSRS